MATMQSGMIYNVWPPLCNWAVFEELCVGSEFKQLEMSRYLINRPSFICECLCSHEGVCITRKAEDIAHGDYHALEKGKLCKRSSCPNHGCYKNNQTQLPFSS